MAGFILDLRVLGELGGLGAWNPASLGLQALNALTENIYGNNIKTGKYRPFTGSRNKFSNSIYKIASSSAQFIITVPLKGPSPTH